MRRYMDGLSIYCIIQLNMPLTNEAKTYFWSFSWRKTNTSDRSMAWTSATRRNKDESDEVTHHLHSKQQNKEWRPETSWTFESSSRVFQLQRSVVQQLPPSDQVLFSKHLAALHPHDRLTVSATGDHRKHTPCLPCTHLSLVHTEFQRSAFWTSCCSCYLKRWILIEWRYRENVWRLLHTASCCILVYSSPHFFNWWTTTVWRAWL